MSDISKEQATFNAFLERYSEICYNNMISRGAWFKDIWERRARIDESCGFIPLGQPIPIEAMRDMYDREPIANRVVSCLPKESWQVQPHVIENEDRELTEFEQAFQDLQSGLNGDNSYYNDVLGSALWEFVARGDELSGIGTFGIILLGLADGRLLEQPVAGSPPDGNPFTIPNIASAGMPSTARTIPGVFGRADQGPTLGPGTAQQTVKSIYGQPTSELSPESSIMDAYASTSRDIYGGATQNPVSSVLGTDAQYRGIQFTPGFYPSGDPYGPINPYAMPGMPPQQAVGGVTGRGNYYQGGNGNGNGNGRNGKNSKKSQQGTYIGGANGPLNKLLFLRVFDESLVQVVQYEADLRNPRFGRPIMYLVTLNDPRYPHTGIGLPLATLRVHWSRVIHLADNIKSSEIFGLPRMQPVFNRIIDLRKLYGGSAEMYWQGALPGISFETQPQLGGDAIVDVPALKKMIHDYVEGLERYIHLQGLTARTLAPTVVSPTDQIETQIQAICIQLGIPIRVFKGSERGEMASSQDDASWNDKLRLRQNLYISPRVIAPLVDRLITLGVLPKPEKYKIKWPDLDSQTDAAKAAIAAQRTQALSAFTSGNPESVMTPTRYYTDVWGLELEKAEQIVEEAVEAQEAQQMATTASGGLETQSALQQQQIEAQQQAQQQEQQQEQEEASTTDQKKKAGEKSEEEEEGNEQKAKKNEEKVKKGKGRKKGKTTHNTTNEIVDNVAKLDRIVSGLLGRHEVSLSGQSYNSRHQSVKHAVEQHLREHPDADLDDVRHMAKWLSSGMHFAKEEHWEAGREGTFTHNHPNGALLFSPKDLETANLRGYKTMIVVAPKAKGILIAHRPSSGLWPTKETHGSYGPGQYSVHDRILKEAGVKFERQPLSRQALRNLIQVHHGITENVSTHNTIYPRILILNENTESHTPTLAIDLDGTLANYDKWRGEDHFGSLRTDQDGYTAADGMRDLHNLGCRLIIWTTRGNTERVREWLDDNEVPYDTINENPDQPEGTSRKVIADLYADDRAIDARKPWREIVKDIKSRISTTHNMYDGSALVKSFQRLGKLLSQHEDPSPMPGYGQIFINDRDDGGKEAQVWYVGGDGDEDGFHKLVEREVRKVFPGVSKVIYEAETFPKKDEGWVQVYPKYKKWITNNTTNSDPSHLPRHQIDTSNISESGLAKLGAGGIQSQRHLLHVLGAPIHLPISLHSIYPTRKGISTIIESPHYYIERTLDPKERIVHNDWTIVHNKGGGLGTQIFAAQVHHLSNLGWKAIHNNAARWTTTGEQLNGYSTWPKLGYNGTFSDAERRKMPEEYQHVKTIQQLYREPHGREWWEEHGWGKNLEFKLGRNTTSRRVLNAYLKARARKLTGNMYMNEEEENNYEMPEHRIDEIHLEPWEKDALEEAWKELENEKIEEEEPFTENTTSFRKESHLESVNDDTNTDTLILPQATLDGIREAGRVISSSENAMPMYGQIFYSNYGTIWYVSGTEGNPKLYKKVMSALTPYSKRITYKTLEYPPVDGSWWMIYPRYKKWDGNVQNAQEMGYGPERALLNEIQKVGRSLQHSSPNYGQIFSGPSGQLWYVGDDVRLTKIARDKLHPLSKGEIIYQAAMFPPQDGRWYMLYPEYKKWVGEQTLVKRESTKNVETINAEGESKIIRPTFYKGPLPEHLQVPSYSVRHVEVDDPSMEALKGVGIHSHAHLLHMLGIPGHLPISHHTVTSDAHGVVSSEVWSPHFDMMRYIDPHNKVIHNEAFGVTKTGTGLGSQIFHNQVRRFTNLGFHAIHTEAMRDRDMNGHYTWPLLGYNGKLSEGERKNLPREYQHAEDMHQLFAIPGAAKWWKKNGWTKKLSFDLTPGSEHHKRLDAYMAASAKKRAEMMSKQGQQPTGNASRRRREELDLAPWEEEAALEALRQRFSDGSHTTENEQDENSGESADITENEELDLYPKTPAGETLHFTVYRNPSTRYLHRMINSDPSKVARAVIHPTTGDAYVWTESGERGKALLHERAALSLGLPENYRGLNLQKNDTSPESKIHMSSSMSDVKDPDTLVHLQNFANKHAPYIESHIKGVTTPTENKTSPIVAGLAVVAKDTGRVLMLQRKLKEEGQSSTVDNVSPQQMREGFRKVISENPTDPTHHLIYADWLEERNHLEEAERRRATGYALLSAKRADELSREAARRGGLRIGGLRRMTSEEALLTSHMAAGRPLSDVGEVHDWTRQAFTGLPEQGRPVSEEGMHRTAAHYHATAAKRHEDAVTTEYRHPIPVEARQAHTEAALAHREAQRLHWRAAGETGPVPPDSIVHPFHL